MGRYEVACRNPDGPDYDRRIDTIGGPDFGGWQMKEDDAIRQIRTGQITLYVRRTPNALSALAAFGTPPIPRTLIGGSGILGQLGMLDQVEMVVKPGGLLSLFHLQTVADGIETDNLQSLPRCPAAYRLVTSLP